MVICGVEIDVVVAFAVVVVIIDVVLPQMDRMMTRGANCEPLSVVKGSGILSEHSSKSVFRYSPSVFGGR